MSKRRTRQQKVNAHRPVYHLPTTSPSSGQSPVARKRKASAPSYEVSMGYDTRLLRTDIFKTLLVSGAILGLELVIYFYWS